MTTTRVQVTNAISASDAKHVSWANCIQGGKYTRHAQAAFAKIRASCVHGEFRCELSSKNHLAMVWIRELLESCGFTAVLRNEQSGMVVLAVSWH